MRKMKKDFMILSNDFREGGIQMNYIKQKIAGSKAKEKFQKKSKNNNSFHGYMSPTTRFNKVSKSISFTDFLFRKSNFVCQN